MQISFEQDIYSRHLTQEMTHDEFVALLEDASQEHHDSRDDLLLFNATGFRDSTNKRWDNMSSISATVLDFDGCQVPWQDVSDVFRDFYHVIYNSFNNGIKEPEKGSRFRLVLPYSLTMPSDNPEPLKGVYEHFWRIFQYRLGDIESGLDISKINANAFYYMPSKTDHPIWHVHETDYLNPVKLLESDELARVLEMNEAQKEAYLDHVERKRKKSKKAAEKILYRYADKSPHTGNKMFFKYACALFYKGFDMNTIQELLNENYDMFWNIPARKQEIPHIMRTLSTYHR